MLNGYGGHILRVDLTSGLIHREKTDPAYMLEVIGGRGLNSTRLYEELVRDCDPLGPENLLLIGDFQVLLELQPGEQGGG